MAAEAKRLIGTKALPRERVAVAGPSATAAEAKARELLAGGAMALVSFGLAAGLHPLLRPGVVVMATVVITPTGETLATQTLWRGRLVVYSRLVAQILEAPLAGIDRPLASAADKAALRAASGAVAADMESHGVARAAAAAKVPFIVVRAIADAADREIPPAALAALRADGQISFGRLLARLLRHPGESWDLLRLSAAAPTALAALKCIARAGGEDLAFPG